MRNQKQEVRSSLSRRRFLRTTATAGGAVAAYLSFPRKQFALNSETLKIGLVGCGGRGTGAAVQALAADQNTVLTAMADAFEDRLKSSLDVLKSQSGERVQVDPGHCFVGFDACEKLIHSDVDVVLLAAPPGFRPAHLKACVEAGKHIFCEKPVAVDAPGVRSVLATVEEARKKKLALVSGLCWRYSTAERETFKQIHDGAVGKITTVYSTYNTSPLWNRPRQPEWNDMEYQMRNWYYFAWLSGDHIVEQAIHSIDKMCWVMNGELPTKAIALGGRQARLGPDWGHIYDHFSVTYDYASGAKGFHHCRQQQGCANETKDYILGTKGSCEIEGSRRLHIIRGEKEWKYEGQYNNMYQAEHDELFASIRKGEPINDGVWMTHSTMMAILGRMAAYTGQSITWEQAIHSQENLAPLKLEWGPTPFADVAIPGQTKLS
jgi:myo-inositol 2-dehydrogenase/D-chiro-inositol 1-dehydrogenase